VDTPCIEWEGSLTRKGYGQVTLTIDGRRKPWRVHRVEWMKHHGPIPDGLHVLHKCDNRKCYNIEHLFLGTDLDNHRDRISKGRPSGARQGELHGKAKLSNDTVRFIKLALQDGASKSYLARQFSVTPAAIRNIAIGKTWGWMNVNTMNQ
jgi:hypothetical protein